VRGLIPSFLSPITWPDFQPTRSAGLPPFQGGAAGLLSYDLGRQLENLPRPAYDEFQLPAMAVGLYDVVIAWDHLDRRGWIISQGFPETESAARQRRAKERLDQFRSRLAGPRAGRPFRLRCLRTRAASRRATRPAIRGGGQRSFTSNFSETAYLDAVRRVIDYIVAGDVFQVNLAQRLLFAARTDSANLYLRCGSGMPRPLPDISTSASFKLPAPLRNGSSACEGDRSKTRPIKGTRPRSSSPKADHAMGEELRQSPKDRAENVMIVDLLRNDLSRVCEPQSVCVSRLCELEAYRYVQHLVSAVRGRLRDGHGPIELVRAAFPGGSVTGAPKVRAMEIIAELEPTARGAYCGSLGYLGFDGSLDLNILIRTITAGRGWWQGPRRRRHCRSIHCSARISGDVGQGRRIA